MNILGVLFCFIILSVQSQNETTICLIGLNLYGDYHPFVSYRDPRLLMGTYNEDIDIPPIVSDFQDVDYSQPVYVHSKYGETDSNYIFKVSDVGWVVSEEAPGIAEESSIKLTCFEDNIFICDTYAWYWGYNTSIHSICTLKITTGQCDSHVIFPFSAFLLK